RQRGRFGRGAAGDESRGAVGGFSGLRRGSTLARPRDDGVQGLELDEKEAIHEEMRTSPSPLPRSFPPSPALCPARAPPSPLSAAARACGLSGGLGLSLPALADALTAEQREKLTPDQILELMRKGNARFARGERKNRDYLREQKASYTGGQHPAAVILSCIDS